MWGAFSIAACVLGLPAAVYFATLARRHGRKWAVWTAAAVGTAWSSGACGMLCVGLIYSARGSAASNRPLLLVFVVFPLVGLLLLRWVFVRTLKASRELRQKSRDRLAEGGPSRDLYRTCLSCHHGDTTAGDRVRCDVDGNRHWWSYWCGSFSSRGSEAPDAQCGLHGPAEPRGKAAL
jgi:hypothetical protein